MSSLKVAHIAGGCVSGSPLRIVNALNKYTQHEATLVSTMREDARRYFDIGVCWRNQREEAIEIIRAADIVHAHGVKVIRELRPYFNPKAPVIFHGHGVPTPEEIDELASKHVYIVSILQYPERYVPTSRLLPNIIELEEPVGEHVIAAESARIFYSPTFKISSWRVGETNKRWLTKGNTETASILQRMKANRNHSGDASVSVNYVNNLPFEACMALKRSSNIVIDDTVTGSYHLVGLESLAMGIPTVGFVDSRIGGLLKSITGAESLPWINTRLEDLEQTLGVLACDGSLRAALGEASYRWIQKYYREEQLIQHFSKAYEDLLYDPHSFGESRFDFASKKAQWHVRDSYDFTYLSRKCKTQRGGSSNIQRDDFERNILSDRSDTGRIFAYFWIWDTDIPFGSWLYENRQCRIDPYSAFFHDSRRKGVLNKYKKALPYAKGVRVVDLGSGTGFGAKLLKEEGAAVSVLGIEKDMVATAYAQEVYSCDGVMFREKNALNSELPKHSFDLVTVIDLIESVDCDGALLQECIRLLADGGTCVISAGDLWDEASEVFYKRRYTPQSFRNCLKGWFETVTLYRQLGRGDPSFLGTLVPEEGGGAPLKEGESLIAVCSL